MDKKVCVITGANSAVGQATVVGMVKAGYHVVMVCRNLKRGETAYQAVCEQVGSSDAALRTVDLSLKFSIKAFVRGLLQEYPNIDVLIHHAAAFSRVSEKRVLSSEQIESVWAANHLGTVLLTNLLQEALQAGGGARVIISSSTELAKQWFPKVELKDPEFKRKTFNLKKAFYQSKLAQEVYAGWLAQEMKGTHVTVNAVRLPDLRDAGEVIQAIADTYVRLASSEEMAGETGSIFDTAGQLVPPLRYAQNPKNAAKVMALTEGYFNITKEDLDKKKK